MDEQIRFFIADDHKLFAEGLENIINSRPNYTVIGKAQTGKELLRHLTGSKPHIIMLDLHMPEMNGLDAVEEIHKLYPHIKIIIVSMYLEAKMIDKLKTLPIHGYIPKDADIYILQDAIKKVIEGGYYFYAVGPQKDPPDDLPQAFKQFGLTKRELEIIELIKQGYTSKEVADRLCLSNYTVETHRKNILRKLNLNSSTALVKFAVENKL